MTKLNLDSGFSIADRAYLELEERIVTLRLPPGSVLSEQGQAADLEFGRTPIREAFRRLEREGLVVILPRRGILVSDINVQTQLNLLDTRREIERLLARQSAERASSEQKEEFALIGRKLREFSDQIDDVTFARWDNRLTYLEFEASQNEFAAKAMGLMHGLSRRFWAKYHRRYANILETAAAHANLAEKIAAGDTAAAAAASDELLDNIVAFTKRTLG
jgi:DNA-binding GntR family transcriptional regulator